MDAPNQACPTCGSPVSSQVIGGLCPKCLARGLHDLPGDNAASSAHEAAESASLFSAHVLELQEQINGGGMGLIFIAKDQTLNRTVVLKKLRPETSSHEADRRFTAEAQITARLEHPAIVPVYQFGRDDQDYPFYTMRQVKGTSLALILEKIRTGDSEVIAQFPVGELLTIFRKTCDAVAYAHSEGILHRDLKPANVMVGKFGEVFVIDWGVAKQPEERVGGATETRKLPVWDRAFISGTIDGDILGTLGFMGDCPAPS